MISCLKMSVLVNITFSIALILTALIRDVWLQETTTLVLDFKSRTFLAAMMLNALAYVILSKMLS